MVPWIAELTVLGLTKSFLCAWILPDFLAFITRPRLRAHTSVSTTIEWLTHTAIQAWLRGAQVHRDLTVESEAIGRAYALVATAILGLAFLVRRTRIARTVSETNVAVGARPAPRTLAYVAHRCLWLIHAYALVLAWVQRATCWSLLLL